MIPILTASEMRAADQATIAVLGQRAVMERAAGECATEILRNHLSSADIRARAHVVVICGPGNNGGDGEIIARLLQEHGVSTGMFSVLTDSLDLLSEQLSRSTMIVDALFGTGTNRALEGAPLQVVRLVNSYSGKVLILAIDLPSGLDASSGMLNGECVRASHTLALQALKICHVHDPAAECCGEISLLEIGIEVKQPIRTLITSAYVGQILRARLARQGGAHKGTRGHVLVVGGGQGHFGAPKMTGLAALSVGSGLATLALPRLTALKFEDEALELMGLALGENSGGGFSGERSAALDELLLRVDSIAVGPGMGTGEGAQKLLCYLLDAPQPIVLDADALNLLSVHPQKLGASRVITPHPGEAGRLLGRSTQEVQCDRFAAARELQERYNCNVVLKGSRTIVISHEGEIGVLPIAASSLGTGGSGDVLTGVIASFLGQGFSASDAMRVGVAVHGEFGRVHPEPLGVTARTLISALGQSAKSLMSSQECEAARPGEPFRVVSRVMS